SDILERLRHPAYSEKPDGYTLVLDHDQARADMKAAADEIERLRAPAQGAPVAKQCLDLAATFENAKRVNDYNPAIRELQSDFTFFDDECKLIAKALRHMAGATNGLAAPSLTEGSR
ncbi:MAG TPA: hypothetical protein VF573_14675, partial [Paraburkholderia sp.]|uniref:hypothetical protein n=1 Tax=Paraburkholderia sp. TaxID=1926495 RepID=UPI002ED23C04